MKATDPMRRETGEVPSGQEPWQRYFLIYWAWDVVVMGIGRLTVIVSLFVSLPLFLSLSVSLCLSLCLSLSVSVSLAVSVWRALVPWLSALASHPVVCCKSWCHAKKAESLVAAAAEDVVDVVAAADVVDADNVDNDVVHADDVVVFFPWMMESNQQFSEQACHRVQCSRGASNPSSR